MSVDPKTGPQHPTTDLGLASFLLCRGAVLAGCRRLGPKKTEFRFRADAALHDLLRLYWSGQPTPLSPMRLMQTMRGLKSLVREGHMKPPNPLTPPRPSPCLPS